MGKKNKAKQQRKPYAGEVKVDSSEVEKSKNQKKTYNFDEGQGEADSDGLLKVDIPAHLEESLLDLIITSKQKYILTGSASKRITSKKLTDLYNCLQNAGFKHNQIEQAMSNTVQYGGDLIDALDWLCLYTTNENLPEGFSEALTEQEQKQRPKFDHKYTSELCDSTLDSNNCMPAKDNSKITVRAKDENSDRCDNVLDGKQDENSQDKVDKSWILQYAEQSDSEESDTNSPQELQESYNENINDRYIEVCALLEDLKCDAADKKQAGDKSAVKVISGRIRDLMQEKMSIEKNANFNPELKTSSVKSSSKDSKQRKAEETKEDQEEEGAVGGFALFEEMASNEVKLVKQETSSSAKLDKRSFEYTRKQWTGKSPKQFLIDWVRKQLPKSPPPKYNKVQVTGNLWKSKCSVVQRDGNKLEVCPNIVCENLKEAEYLASTLALYELCKGQRIYQLLPPPFKDVWIEWQQSENQKFEEMKIEVNKPRDQFIAKLSKKLKIGGESENETSEDSAAINCSVESSGGQEPVPEDDSSVSDCWENALDNDNNDDTVQSLNKTSTCTLSQPSSAAQKSDVSKQLLARYHSSDKHKSLLETRKHLPVYQYRESILSSIKRQNVVVIAGETGSGKSTQIPQFLLQDAIESGLGSSLNIICTEPRRISTTSLATRVCDEIGSSSPGSHDCLCGYQIRFEVKKSEATRLLYCTTGVLLRKLQQDPLMSDVSHVIVDEVHERSVQSDFLLIILKQLLQKRHDLKVILMSATIDAEKFSTFFQHCLVIEIPGRSFPVEVQYLEDVVMCTNYSMEEDSVYALRYEDVVQEERAQVSVTEKGGDSSKRNVVWTKDQYHQVDESGLDVDKYNLKARNIVTRMNPERINMELILELLLYISNSELYKDIDGAVLVFMPGLSHIQELHELLTTDKRFADKKKYKIIALHSILSSSDQNEAFCAPPKGVRKIVIATNIAETGITIPDVVFVVDTGKMKENRYLESSQMSSLEEVYVSKASARQRQGRAGRVRDGYCFRLYTRQKYESLRPFSIPEILRVPLEELCLHIMKCELGEPGELLSQAVDPPPVSSVIRAMAVLDEVGAIKRGQPPVLTALGQHLATLPVNVRVGKMLIYAAILGVLDPVSVIAAAMTEKSCFVTPMGKKDAANLAKSSMSLANSDHVTVLKAYLGWKLAQKSGYYAELEYCNKYFLKRNTLIDIQNISRDLKNLIHTIGFDSVNAYMILKKAKSTKSSVSATGVFQISQSDGSDSISAEHLSPGILCIIKAVLTAGLYPQVAKVTYQAPVDAAANPRSVVCTGTTSQGAIAVHPSSVNRHLMASGYIVYSEKVKGSKVYIRDCSQVKNYCLLLFGGDISVQHKQKLIVVDELVQFKAFAKTGVIFKELRFLLDNLLQRKVLNPKLNLKDEPLVHQLLTLLVSER